MAAPVPAPPDPAFALTTERLTLRHMFPSDAAFLAQLFSAPAFLAGLGSQPITEADALTRLLPGGRYGDAQLRFGYGQFLVALRSSGAAIGSVSILFREGYSVPDIGYAFLDEHNGFGYAAEASTAIITYAKRHWGVMGVVAFTNPKNTRSQRVAEKLGLENRGVYRLAVFGGHSIAVWAEPDLSQDLTEYGIVDATA